MFTFVFQRQDDSEYEYEYESEYEAQDEDEAALGLPSDSKTIRENIVDEFTCDARPYGYVDIIVYILVSCLFTYVCLLFLQVLC